MDLPHLDQLHCKVFPIFLQLEAHHHHHHHHKVYLYGVQVTSWKNDHGQELLFVNCLGWKWILSVFLQHIPPSSFF
ncbi:hypothetical protein ACSBR2_042655 [Camellia fascicularis]